MNSVSRIGLTKTVVRQFAARKFSSTAVYSAARLFDMPAMSPTMESGGIVEWKVSPNQSFAPGDVMLEIETDKAEIAVESTEEAKLVKILVENGAKDVPIGTPIGIIADISDDVSQINIDELLAKSASSNAASASAPSAAAPEPTPAPEKPVAEPSQTPASAPTPSNPHRVRVLPSAMRLLKKHNISPESVQGSGPLGRITKGDVLAKIGHISSDHVVQEQSRLAQLSKLDLDNVVRSESKPASSSDSKPNAAKVEKEKLQQPKSLVTKVSIPLTENSAKLVESAKRAALRSALLALKPKPSILRSETLDFLTAARAPPFSVKESIILVRRAKPVSLELVIEEPFNNASNPAVGLFVAALKTALA